MVCASVCRFHFYSAAGVDVGTLASLLGHSTLVMLMRYVHPGEAHRTDVVNKLEVANAAKEIAEVERNETRQFQMVPTESPTLLENTGDFSREETEGESQRIN